MSSRKGSVSRRDFVRTAGAIAAAPMIVPSSVLGQRAGAVAPSDKIAIAGIGIGARGMSSLNVILSYQDARFVAICDVKNDRREVIKSLVDKRYQSNDCMMYAYQEEVLARPDIDAVIIATPEFWHAPLSVQAAYAGKDVYCEKPCSMSIQESWALADAFRRTGRIYQAGTQRRNGPNFIWAVEAARTGKLGKLQTVHANVGTYIMWPPIPSKDWLPASPSRPSRSRLGSLAWPLPLAALQFVLCHRQRRLEQLVRLPWRRNPGVGFSHRGPVPVGRRLRPHSCHRIRAQGSQRSSLLGQLHLSQRRQTGDARWEQPGETVAG